MRMDVPVNTEFMIGKGSAVTHTRRQDELEVNR